MSFPLFFLGLAPRSLNFPTSNIVKAIAIASFATLSANALVKTAAPSEAGHDHKLRRKNEKTAQEADLSLRIESGTPIDTTTTESIDNYKASHITELAESPKDIFPAKDIDIAADNMVTQGTDSTANAHDMEIDTDNQEACASLHNDVQEITVNATSLVTSEDFSVNSSNVRFYRHSFPAADIVEIVEVPSKQASVHSYRHSLPAADIIEVVEVLLKQATVITSPISSDPAPKDEEAVLHHFRKESTETNFSTESRQTVNSEVSDNIPGTPDTVYSEPALDSAQDLTPSNNAKLRCDESRDNAPIPATLTKTPSHWYDLSPMSAEERQNLDTVIVIDRPDSGVSYAQLTSGLWYRMDENDNPLMMTQEEYEDLLAWFAGFEKKEQDIQLLPPIVLVTDEEGNEFLAEEIDEASFIDQPEDNTEPNATNTIILAD
ncbi:hypothetical protein QBC45DRAFT_456970 [Copromyces sp. CBS 386.78]|nr:hypothetical protein QBC45DRAFT_456970 [Copromyces sp. CBS 386.78]